VSCYVDQIHDMYGVSVCEEDACALLLVNLHRSSFARACNANNVTKASTGTKHMRRRAPACNIWGCLCSMGLHPSIAQVALALRSLMRGRWLVNLPCARAAAADRHAATGSTSVLEEAAPLKSCAQACVHKGAEEDNLAFGAGSQLCTVFYRVHAWQTRLPAQAVLSCLL